MRQLEESRFGVGERRPSLEETGTSRVVQPLLLSVLDVAEVAPPGNRSGAAGQSRASSGAYGPGMKIRALLWSPMLLLFPGCLALRTTPEIAPEAGSGGACTTTDGTTAVNGLLADLTPVLNKAWPSVAVSTGLDPWENPVPPNTKVKLKCEYGGTETCGGFCKEEYALVTVSTLRGLAYMQFKDLALTSLKAVSGNSPCPFSTSTKGGTYGCSYQGNGAGSAFLIDDQSLSATISKIEVKAECDIPYVKSWTETLWSGSAKCTGTSPEGSGSFNLCGGSCASSGVANISVAALSSLDLKLGKLSCDVSPDYNLLSTLAEDIIPYVKSSILDAIEPEVKKALNDFVAGYMPFPSACGN